jgi:hypothetical protein
MAIRRRAAETIIGGLQRDTAAWSSVRVHVPVDREPQLDGRAVSKVNRPQK